MASALMDARLVANDDACGCERGETDCLLWDGDRTPVDAVAVDLAVTHQHCDAKTVGCVASAAIDRNRGTVRANCCCHEGAGRGRGRRDRLLQRLTDLDGHRTCEVGIRARALTV